MSIVERNIDKIIILCNLHKVKELYVFGSAITDDFTENSDIDLLIQFDSIDPVEYFDNYMDIKEKLEALFNRPIDLVENQAIKNPIFRRSIDNNKKLIYERKST